jgi:twitching motility protein PilT
VAVLDRYLEELFKRQANALVFTMNKVVEIHVRGQVQRASSRPASAEQIMMLSTEVLGPDFAQHLTDGVGAFLYESPYGEVTITVTQDGAGFALRVEPPAALLSNQGAASRAPTSMNSVVPVPTIPPPNPMPSIAPVPRSLPPQTIVRSKNAVASIPGHMDELFNQMIELKASDLHLKSGDPPVLRIDGSMVPLGDRGALSADVINRLLTEIMPERNLKEFAALNDTDFAYETTGARVRCNVFRDMVGVGACFRQIPWKILTAKELNLPPAVLNVCEYDRGLVIVTGPTGSGKSTTLAALIDVINETRDDHLITIEDPIEFVHKKKRAHINQREVGTHTASFKSALRAALREDPDTVLVGEMRDLETVAIAIETAETGHLVFGTLHTNTAASTIDRLIDQFPADRQEQVRSMLAESLRCIVAQQLLKRRGGGRIAALEVLIVTKPVANLIREGKTYQIATVMQTGRSIGMQTLNDSMLNLVKAGLVDPQEAYDRSFDKQEFLMLMGRAGVKGNVNDTSETAAPPAEAQPKA